MHICSVKANQYIIFYEYIQMTRLAPSILGIAMSRHFKGRGRLERTRTFYMRLFQHPATKPATINPPLNSYRYALTSGIVLSWTISRRIGEGVEPCNILPLLEAPLPLRPSIRLYFHDDAAKVILICSLRANRLNYFINFSIILPPQISTVASFVFSLSRSSSELMIR